MSNGAYKQIHDRYVQKIWKSYKTTFTKVWIKILGFSSLIISADHYITWAMEHTNKFMIITCENFEKSQKSTFSKVWIKILGFSSLIISADHYITWAMEHTSKFMIVTWKFWKSYKSTFAKVWIIFFLAYLIFEI